MNLKFSPDQLYIRGGSKYVTFTYVKKCRILAILCYICNKKNIVNFPVTYVIKKIVIFWKSRYICNKKNRDILELSLHM